jgi:hypothetical protein
MAVRGRRTNKWAVVCKLGSTGNYRCARANLHPEVGWAVTGIVEKEQM